jgi:hypothetical protein
MEPKPFKTNDVQSSPTFATANAGIIRMIVEETYQQSAGFGPADKSRVLKCRLYDGVNKGATDYYVRRACNRHVGQEINAFQPENGTGLIFDETPVEWAELLTLPENPRKWDVLICVDDFGTLMWERVRFVGVRDVDRTK